ncbi:acyl carrier protein [Nocardiopsis ganjiahuensis]|uniref:acyl carrier protein n=1 Tax=Nocardiopsis ganjiahuensis TaxID=239984 RepID=UPI00034C4571|nr:acyl carrier protein [Nocardiopsis ganjiahuensis]
MTQDRVTIEEMVELISTCAGIRTDVPTASTSSFEDLGVDSLGVLGIVAAIESRIGRRLGADAELLPSPTSLVAFVNEDAPASADRV